MKHRCLMTAARAILLSLMPFAAAAMADDEALQPAGKPRFRIATFSADVTIPLNHRCMGTLPTKSQRILDPLYAHGLVLLGADAPIVLCAVDWCEIRNDAYDQWRSELADAAGTTRERVLVCALHQHDAPVADRGAAQLLDSVGLPNELYDVAFHDRTLHRVAAALRDSLRQTTAVTHIGLGEARVVDIASSRRVVMSDGRVTFGRGSRSGADPFLRSYPAGEVDPVLKTLSFWNGDSAVVAVHSYATHPMSYYGQGEVSSDFVGLARDRRQRDDFSVRQIYVSGCSGDVTAGKFNDGSQQDRVELTQRLYDGMVEAWNKTRRIPLRQATFRRVPLTLPFHSKDSLTESALRHSLHDDRLSVEERILAAMGLASRQRVANGQPIDLVGIDFGPAFLVLFPGESFVGYQLMAQRLMPDKYVMSIGYGECWPGYIPTASAFTDGFDDKWLWVDQGSEARVHHALQQLIK